MNEEHTISPFDECLTRIAAAEREYGEKSSEIADELEKLIKYLQDHGHASKCLPLLLRVKEIRTYNNQDWSHIKTQIRVLLLTKEWPVGEETVDDLQFPSYQSNQPPSPTHSEKNKIKWSPRENSWRSTVGSTTTSVVASVAAAVGSHAIGGAIRAHGRVIHAGSHAVSHGSHLIHALALEAGRPRVAACFRGLHYASAGVGSSWLYATELGAVTIQIVARPLIRFATTQTLDNGWWALGTVGSGIGSLAGGVVSYGSVVASTVGTGVVTSAAAVGSVATTVGDGVVKGATTVGTGVVSGAAAVGSGVATVATTVGSGVVTGASTVGSGVVAGATTVGSGIGTVASTVGTGVVTGASTVGSGIGTVASTVGTGVVTGATTVGSGIGTVASTVGSGVVTGASTVGSGVATVAGAAGSGVLTTVGAVNEVVATGVTMTVDAMVPSVYALGVLPTKSQELKDFSQKHKYEQSLVEDQEKFNEMLDQQL